VVKKVSPLRGKESLAITVYLAYNTHKPHDASNLLSIKEYNPYKDIIMTKAIIIIKGLAASVYTQIEAYILL
jgi:hypothetical protein